MGERGQRAESVGMSPEYLTALSSIVTAAVITASAVAAVIQLRHMRAGNSMQLILSVRAILEDDEHRHAMNEIRGGDLQRALDDPQFRRYVYRRLRRLPTKDAPQQFRDLMDAATRLANFFELIGGMMRRGVASGEIFLPNYWWIVLSNWDRMEAWIAMAREYAQSDGLYVDFEYLTVLSRKWADAHPDSYAHGVPRIPVTNPHPLTEQPWLNEAN